MFLCEFSHSSAYAQRSYIYEMLGLRCASLSAITKADAGQNASSNHINPNVLYMMCALCIRRAHRLKAS
jgi:hypothetical protein